MKKLHSDVCQTSLVSISRSLSLSLWSPANHYWSGATPQHMCIYFSQYHLLGLQI